MRKRAGVRNHFWSRFVVVQILHLKVCRVRVSNFEKTSKMSSSMWKNCAGTRRAAGQSPVASRNSMTMRIALCDSTGIVLEEEFLMHSFQRSLPS